MLPKLKIESLHYAILVMNLIFDCYLYDERMVDADRIRTLIVTLELDLPTKYKVERKGDNLVLE